jgi:hypothetical protein
MSEWREGDCRRGGPEERRRAGKPAEDDTTVDREISHWRNAPTQLVKNPWRIDKCSSQNRPSQINPVVTKSGVLL